MQNATCVAFFCRCKMPHMVSEVMVGKMRLFVNWTLRTRKTISFNYKIRIFSQLFGRKGPRAQDSRIQVFVLQGFDHCFEHSLDFPALYICKQSLCDICLTFTLLKLFHLNPGLLEPLDPGSSPTDREKNHIILYTFPLGSNHKNAISCAMLPWTLPYGIGNITLNSNVLVRAGNYKWQ